ncbi:MAG: DUF4347 domain-containing protein [Elainella sp.]
MSSQPSTALSLYQSTPDLDAVTSTLVVVDSYIQDLSPVVQALDSSAILMRLNPHYNGIEQISARLIQCRALQRMHLLVQGRAGAMRLGSLWLTHAHLEAHQTALERWQQAFAPQAEIHLHSPNVAMGLEGMEFVGRLSQLTGAVVVATNLSIGRSAVQPLHGFETLPLAS